MVSGVTQINNHSKRLSLLLHSVVCYTCHTWLGTAVAYLSVGNVGNIAAIAGIIAPLRGIPAATASVTAARARGAEALLRHCAHMSNTISAILTAWCVLQRVIITVELVLQLPACNRWYQYCCYCYNSNNSCCYS